MSELPDDAPKSCTKNITQEIDDIEKGLVQVEKDMDEIGETVEKEMDCLVDKYQDQLKTFGKLDDVRKRVKDTHRQRLTQDKESLLKKAKYKLEKEKDDLIIFP